MFCRKLVFAIVLLAGVAHAQFLGYTAQQTVAPVALFTAQASGATSTTISNFGQSSHALLFCWASTFFGTIDLEGTPDGTNWVILAIGDYNNGASGAQCHSLQAGGYFNGGLRSKVTVSSGAISAWYSGVSSPIASVPSGLASTGPQPPLVCDLFYSQTIANGATTPVAGPLNAGDQIYVCGFTVSFPAAPSAGTVSIGFAATAGCTSPQQSWGITTTSLTPQILIVPIPLYSQRGGVLTSGCLTNSSGQNLILSMSYTSFHPL